MYGSRESRGLQVRIFEDNNEIILQKMVNDFLDDVIVVDIKFSHTCVQAVNEEKGSYDVNFAVMIVYQEK